VLTALVLASVAAFATWQGLERPPRFAGPRASSALWLMLAWFVGPIAVGVAISLVGQPIFIARYIICCLPALIVMASVGLSRLGGTSMLRLGFVSALSLGLCWLSLAYGTLPPRPDWRSATAFVVSHLPGNGCVMVIGRSSAPLMYYYGQNHTHCFLPPRPDPARIPTNDIFAMVVGVAGDSLLHGLPSPPWRAVGKTDFNMLQVVEFRRAS
jgi:hypothetical protein